MLPFLYQTMSNKTYHSLACYTPGFPQLVPGFARCTLAHHQTEGDWCRSLNVSELLHHKSQCILPSLTIQSIRQVPLRGNSREKKKKRMACYWLIVNCRQMLQKVILTTIVWVTFLGFHGGSQVLLDAGWSTAGRRGIGTGPWAFLNSSTTRHATFSPFRPANITTRHR